MYLAGRWAPSLSTTKHNGKSGTGFIPRCADCHSTIVFKCRGKTRNKLLTNLCAYFPLLFSGTCCILCISTFQVPVDDTVQLDKIRKERNYTYEDQVECSREKLPNYDEQVRRNFPHTPFCSRDKLPRKSKVEFPPTPFCS
jgi:hypothetical protein